MSLFLVLTRTDKLLSREAVAFDQHLSTTTPLHEPSPWQPPFSSVSMNLAFLDSTYKWYHSVFVFLCLTYCILHNAHKILPCCHIYMCVCVCVCVCVSSVQFSRSVMSDSLQPHGTTAHQASLSITNSRSLLKLMSIDLDGDAIQPSNHVTLCCPLLLPPSVYSSIRVFSNESVLRIRWPKYCSFSFSISLPMNIQDWFPLRWTGWIFLLSNRLPRVFSNTTVQKHQFFSAQLSL